MSNELTETIAQYLAERANITTMRKYYLALRTEDLQSSIRWLNGILGLSRMGVF
jgi:hypothetical protein